MFFFFFFFLSFCFGFQTTVKAAVTQTRSYSVLDFRWTKAGAALLQRLQKRGLQQKQFLTNNWQSFFFSKKINKRTNLEKPLCAHWFLSEAWNRCSCTPRADVRPEDCVVSCCFLLGFLNRDCFFSGCLTRSRAANRAHSSNNGCVWAMFACRGELKALSCKKK